MSTRVGICGMLGGIGGGMAGWFMGGLPGASTLAQLGGALGVKIGAYDFGARVVGNVANRALNKGLKIVQVATDYALSGGGAIGVWWIASKNMQDQCSSSPNHTTCDVLMWVNTLLVTIEAGAVIYVTKKAIDRLNEEPRREEQRRGTARMDNTETSNNNSFSHQVRSSLHRSATASADAVDFCTSSLR